MQPPDKGTKRATKIANRASSQTANRYIALLRGINVGGKNKLPMKDLANIFATAGCSDVETYIQSGNVVFSAPATLAERLASKVSAEVNRRLGLSAPVVLRTAKELSAVLQENPFLHAGVSEETLHVVFLERTPGPAATAALDPERSPGDEFVIQGKEIYLRLPNGVAASKLTNAYFDAKLKTVSTMRNWRTVAKLCAMARGDS